MNLALYLNETPLFSNDYIEQLTLPQSPSR